MASPTECASCKEPLCEAMVMQCGHDLCIACSTRSMVELPYARIPCAVCARETNLESDTLQYLRTRSATCLFPADSAVCTSPVIEQCGVGGVCHFPHTGVVVRSGSPSGPQARGPALRAGDVQPGSVHVFGVRGAPAQEVSDVLKTNAGPLADKPRPVATRLCDCRERKPVSFWCENCRKLICPDCAVVGGSHKHHHVITMRQATTKVQPDIENFMAGLKNMCHEIELEISNMDRTDRRVTSHLSTSQANLRQAMTEAHDKLKYIEDDISRELDKSAMFATRTIHKYRDELQTKLHVLSKERDNIMEAMGDSDDASLLHQYSELEWKAHDLRDNRLVHRAVPELPLCQQNLTIRLGDDIVGDFHMLVFQNNTRAVPVKGQTDDAILLADIFEGNVAPLAASFSPTITSRKPAQSFAQGTPPSTASQRVLRNAPGPPSAPVTTSHGFAQHEGGPNVAPLTSTQGFVPSNAGSSTQPVPRVQGFAQHTVAQNLVPTGNDQGIAPGARRQNATPCTEGQGAAPWQSVAQRTFEQNARSGTAGQSLTHIAGPQNASPNTAAQSYPPSICGQTFAPSLGPQNCATGVGTQKIELNSSMRVGPTVRFAPGTVSQSVSSSATHDYVTKSTTAGHIAGTPQSPATSFTPPQAARTTSHDHSRPCSCSPSPSSPPCSQPHVLRAITSQPTTPPQGSTRHKGFSEPARTTPSISPKRYEHPSTVPCAHSSYSYHPAQFYGEDLTCGPARNDPCSERFAPKPSGASVKDLLPWRQTLLKPDRGRLHANAPTKGPSVRQVLAADKQRDRSPEDRISKPAPTTGDLSNSQPSHQSQTTLKTRLWNRSYASASSISTPFAEQVLSLAPASGLSSSVDELRALPPASSTMDDATRPSALTSPSRSTFSFPSAGLSTAMSFKTKAKSQARKQTKNTKPTKTNSSFRLAVPPKHTVAFEHDASSQKKTNSAQTKLSESSSVRRGRDDSSTRPASASHRSDNDNALAKRSSVQRGRDDSTTRPSTASHQSDSDSSSERALEKTSVQLKKNGSTALRDASSRLTHSYFERSRASKHSQGDERTTQYAVSLSIPESHSGRKTALRTQEGDDSTTQYSSSSYPSKGTTGSSKDTTTRWTEKTDSSHGSYWYGSSETPRFSSHRDEEDKRKKAQRIKRDKEKKGRGTYGGKMSVVQYNGGSFMSTTRTSDEYDDD